MIYVYLKKKHWYPVSWLFCLISWNTLYLMLFLPMNFCSWFIEATSVCLFSFEGIVSFLKCYIGPTGSLFFYYHLFFFSFLCLIFSVHSKANFIQSSPLSTGDVRGLPWPCLLLCMKRSDYLLRSVGEYTIPSLIPYFRSLSPNILFLLYSSIFLL